MAYIQDSTQTFTISLIGLLEGLGIINYIAVNNETSGIIYRWFLATGWDASPEAIEGDSIVIYVEVHNAGATTDTLFAEFVSAQVTPVEPSRKELPNIAVDAAAGFSWTFIMPATNVSILINAGHVE